MDRLKKQMQFLIEIDKLKNIFRQSLISDMSRNENDAEHSWDMAIMCATLEEYAEPNTDMLKVIKMALIHDIIEIYAGDTFLYDEEHNKTKEKREQEACEKIYSLLPNDQKEYFKSLWYEFEKKETKEAIFCSILDRIQPIILNYLTNGGTWKKHKVCKDMVLKKGYLIFEKAHPNLKNYILNIIDESVLKGYLLP